MTKIAAALLDLAVTAAVLCLLGASGWKLLVLLLVLS